MKIVEYVIIGGGPAAICAIPNILNSGVSGDNIIWIDPQFKVGDFGTKLSKGSSVPGNTMVKGYQRVNNEIYKLIPSLKPNDDHLFELNHLAPNFVGSLKIAAEPMQHISDGLRKIVRSIKGCVTNIFTSPLGLKLEIKLNHNQSIFITTQRTILATGAQPKTFKLPGKHCNITMIDPNIVFIQSELTHYLQNNPGIKTIAVIGSSHSAALAIMHLLQAGITVKQFMNKEYKYACPAVAPDGTEYTLYDNTGLKGDVAQFTKQLLEEIDINSGIYHKRIIRYIGNTRADVSNLLEHNLFDCSHVVTTIGYRPSQTLLVNDLPISELIHNNTTTAFENIKGLFGIGIAFPQVVKAISGKEEPAVGVEKFWNTSSNLMVLDSWRN